jgi:hypothetical protein
MNLREIIDLRDRLKNDLAVVEKFLVIAKRQQGLAENGILDALSNDSPRQKTLAPIISGANKDYGTIGKTIFEAIKLSPNEFTVADVDEVLRNHLNRPLERTQIATVLARLLKQGKVQIIKPKHGRQGATYRRE